MKKITLISTLWYPNGDAGAVRQHAFAKIFKELGYEVTVIGLGESTDFSYKDYDGIRYISLRAQGSDKKTKILNRLWFSKRVISLLKSEELPSAIMLAEPDAAILPKLKKFAKKHNIKLLYDSVEWYSPEQFKHGKIEYGYILNNTINTRWLDKQFTVVSISTFLEKHFRSRDIDTLRIPVIMDIDSISYNKNTKEDKTVFLYAGAPGKKDYLAQIVKGFSLLPKEYLSRAELRLVGITKEQLVSLCGVENDTLSIVENSLVCLGRVPREEVLNQLSEADFTVLLRSELQRYAMAGFPTKFVESLATATPVIANLTSDLSLYLEDGYNGKIVKECSAEAFSKSIKEALELSFEQRCAMYTAARNTAEKHFDYKIYCDDLKKTL